MGFRVQGLGFMGSGFRGLEFQVKGWGFSLQWLSFYRGSGLRALNPKP